MSAGAPSPENPLASTNENPRATNEKPLESEGNSNEKWPEWTRLLWGIPGTTCLYVILCVLLFLFWGCTDLWLAAAILVPACLIYQQGLFVRSLEPKLSKLAPQEIDDGKATLKPREEIFAELKQHARKEFAFAAIAVDYFFPSFLAAVAGAVVGYVLSHTYHARGTLGTAGEQEVYAGIVLGAIGAYVYVVSNLAQRAMLRDITPGVAIWSAGHLYLGPILGGVVASVWQPTVQPTGYGQLVLYFFAGLSPREIVAILQNVAWRSIAGAQAQQALGKLIPLQTVRGIDQTIAARLLEEGITDGYMLAMADPIKLFRNTPYSLRQILGWMDECLLITTLPDYVEALRKAGITGAIALIKSYRVEATFNLLAEKIGLDKGLLGDVAKALAEDRQLRKIYALSIAEEAGATRPS